ncbi:hypothetical protein E1A91_D02G172900v1 [Gossypium mustelinum]|uniref:Uncharacterized protein n=3 Tax=Gossypium TaxID=3633 RepID=A0A5D2VX46_GOSMU|nr:hypothetical protein ES319_D02G166800v1 [Gossypium barbadense]TYH84236.1 hypothetical protein ES332_D02G184200v1 [Gossypium tomentosum]TYI93980.1 hypothetical protein E1A91_D02G172900v1 [Gossypium mustelinum]TYI93981.1 hypothetical protein E1A91_D02G172900v1 [Gossypium mustelinum]TYI93982.1 hypothetical protein E1A91_D02G172900v1 [Gossypium mustelinum]
MIKNPGISPIQSLNPCPIHPHPKQKVGKFSYLKEIHNFR